MKAGSIANQLSEWGKITSDPETSSAVSGLPLDFSEEIDYKISVTPSKFFPKEEIFLSVEIKNLHENHCIFNIASLLKITRPGFYQQPLEFRRYTDQSLYVITYIKWYLLETKKLRHSDGGYFISFKPPHKIVTSTTVARWMVDGKCFKGSRCKCLPF